MRSRGCVAGRENVDKYEARSGDPTPTLRGWERNAESVWRVSLNTGWFAIPETIDARRGTQEV